MEDNVMNDQERIAKLEDEVVELKIASEVNKRDIKEVKDSVSKIEGNTNKLVWLVGSFIILAVLSVILKGGVQL